MGPVYSFIKENKTKLFGVAAVAAVGYNIIFNHQSYCCLLKKEVIFELKRYFLN